MVILLWGVQYHENRVPGMASQKVTVRINAQVIETTERLVDPGLDIACDAS